MCPAGEAGSTNSGGVSISPSVSPYCRPHSSSNVRRPEYYPREPDPSPPEVSVSLLLLPGQYEATGMSWSAWEAVCFPSVVAGAQ